jgi:UDP-galactopyranose mutase
VWTLLLVHGVLSAVVLKSRVRVRSGYKSSVPIMWSQHRSIDSAGLLNVGDGWTSIQGTSFDVCVVGAGLSGAVLAERYATVLNKSVLVIDKRDHIAGNCYDFVEPETGILMNLYGAHLFHTESERVFRYITKPEWQDKAPWVRWDHEVKGVLKGKVLPIPVNIETVNSLFGMNIKSTSEMDIWLKNVQEPCTNTSFEETECKDAESMAISRVGRELYELIFKPYTQKQWGKSPADLDASVTARIPVRNNHDPRYFSDKYQILPAFGYTKWFAAVLDHPRVRIALRTDYFEHMEELSKMCKKTFFTGPIDQYFWKEGLGQLEYRSIRFEREILHNFNFFQRASVVNYPGMEVNFTRIVEYKHFLNQESKHSVIVKEFSSDQGDPYYPVPNQRNRDLYLRYKELATREEKEKSVYFVGRLANYKYFNMDQAIENALDMFQHIEGTDQLGQFDIENCWKPGLRTGDISVVYGTNSASQESTNKIAQWLSIFPVTNATVHVYFRSTSAYRLHRNSVYSPSNLSCGVRLKERMLIPNRGNEAAVFLAYIVENYQSLPEMIVFMHDHGAQSWHSETEIFFRRLKAFYNGVLQDKYDMKVSEEEKSGEMLHSRFSAKTRSLSSCYHEGPETASPVCIRHVQRRKMLDDPDMWKRTYDVFESILRENGSGRVNRGGEFWSCCASFVARRNHILQQPLEFYRKSLDAILELDVPSAVSGRWWEYNWYRLMGMQNQTLDDLMDYVVIDGRAWPTGKLNLLLTGRPFGDGFH